MILGFVRYLLSGCVHVVEIVKMDDEGLYYIPDEANAATYHMLPKNSKLGYQKELEKFTSE
jgi:hypothetical protein